MSTLAKGSGEDMELRRGPWTLEEDSLLIQYIACHGEGRWDMLAKCSGLRRTGKSCRLRWLNYLKPDVKRGNLTLEEQVSILELHSKWGNRWSRIAQHLPGRTDNEIKNYWRTRVQKHARQLKIDSNSAKFHDVIRCFWMPRLLQKMEENPHAQSSTPPIILNQGSQAPIQPSLCASEPTRCFNREEYTSCSENCNSPSISSSVPERSVENSSGYLQGCDLDAFNLNPLSEMGQCGNSVPSCQLAGNDWFSDGMSDALWNLDELWQFTKVEQSSI